MTETVDLLIQRLNIENTVPNRVIIKQILQQFENNIKLEAIKEYKQMIINTLENQNNG